MQGRSARIFTCALALACVLGLAASDDVPLASKNTTQTVVLGSNETTIHRRELSDNEESAESVHTESVKSEKVTAQARGGRGGQQEQEQPQEEEQAMKPEDIPMVGGMVSKVMKRPIPFVGKKKGGGDEVEEAEEYEYNDGNPATNGLNGSPTEASDPADLPLVGGLVSNLLNIDSPPDNQWAKPGPPIVTQIPFINDDDGGESAQSVHTQGVVTAQDSDMLPVADDPIVDGADIPVAGDLVDRVVNSPTAPVAETPGADPDEDLKEFLPPMFPNLPPAPDVSNFVDAFNGATGQFNIESAGVPSSVAKASTDQDSDSEDEDSDSDSSSDTNSSDTNSEYPDISDLERLARPLVSIASPPPGPSPDVSLGPPFTPWNSMPPDGFVHQEQGAQKTEASSVSNGFSYHALLLPALCVCLLVAITALVTTLSRKKLRLDSFEAEDSSELAKLLPDEMQGKSRSFIMSNHHPSYGATAVEAVELSTEYNPEGQTFSAVAVELPEAEDEFSNNFQRVL